MITINDLMTSWRAREGVNSTKDILAWIETRNKELKVSINPITLEECSGWMYDKASGMIRRNNMSFFAIAGLQKYKNNVLQEQPVILQPEIGYLGIICKKIDGVLHFLMQSKIEPGNINTVQLSPTIQATKSNFTQKHGGSKPAYLEFFLSVAPEKFLVDQIQSEQSSRFLHKRNRNIIRVLDEDEEIEILPSHKWMTLGQIKRLMKEDNLVNMDTRTVISCIPFALLEGEKPAWMGGAPDREKIVEIYNEINNYKMFDYVAPEVVDVYSLTQWKMKNGEFVGGPHSAFKVIFCDISIEGREVRRWNQPLFAATGKALFGLLTAVDSATGKREFLVKCMPEVGCFDGVEIGPTIQQEAFETNRAKDEIVYFFEEKMRKEKPMTDVMLSEEGGRFYHEENRNLILEVDKNEVPKDVAGYHWCDFATLNYLTQVNNCLNIQLRNLLSLLDEPTE